MNKEEQEAIEYLKNNALVRIENEQIVASGNAYKVVILNYISKLQKELEYYKEKEEAEIDDFENRDRWE